MAKQKIYKRFKVYTPTELRKIFTELYTVERIKDIFDELTD